MTKGSKTVAKDPMAKNENAGPLEVSRRAEQDAIASGEKDPVLGDKNLMDDPKNLVRTDNSLTPGYVPNDPPQDPLDSVGANPTPETDAANRSFDGSQAQLARRAAAEAEGKVSKPQGDDTE